MKGATRLGRGHSSATVQQDEWCTTSRTCPVPHLCCKSNRQLCIPLLFHVLLCAAMLRTALQWLRPTNATMGGAPAVAAIPVELQPSESSEVELVQSSMHPEASLGVSVSFDAVSVCVPVHRPSGSGAGEERLLLNNVSGYVPPGAMYALMGSRRVPPQWICSIPDLFLADRLCLGNSEAHELIDTPSAAPGRLRCSTSQACAEAPDDSPGESSSAGSKHPGRCLSA